MDNEERKTLLWRHCEARLICNIKEHVESLLDEKYERCQELLVDRDMVIKFYSNALSSLEEDVEAEELQFAFLEYYQEEFSSCFELHTGNKIF